MLFGEAADRIQYVQWEPYGDAPLAFLCILHVPILSQHRIHGNCIGHLAEAESAYLHRLKPDSLRRAKALFSVNILKDNKVKVVCAVLIPSALKQFATIHFAA